jgi:hypothetical protein
MFVVYVMLVNIRNLGGGIRQQFTENNIGACLVGVGDLKGSDNNNGNSNDGVYTKDSGRRIQTIGSKTSSTTSYRMEEPNYYQGDNL